MFENIKKWWNAPDTGGDSLMEPVSWNKRRSALSLIAVSFGWGFTVTPLFIGAKIATMPSTTQMAWSIFLGDVILFVLSILICIPAYRTGCNNPLLFRILFGNKGWVLPALIVCIGGFGWQGSLTGWFAEVVVGVDSKWYSIVALVGGLLVLLSVYFGVKGVEVVGNFSVVFLAAASVICFYLCVREAGGTANLLLLADAEKGVDAPTMPAMISSIVGSIAVGASVSADFTRFCKKGWVVFLFVAINFFLVQPALQILGVTGILVFNTHIFTIYSKLLGTVFYGFCMIAMIFAVWTTCNSNAYFAQVSMSNLTKKNMKVTAVIVGGFGAISAALGIASYVGSWVDFLATAFPPLVGLITADYYIVNKCKYDTKIIANIPDVNIPAVIGYLAAAIIGFLWCPAFLPTAVWCFAIAFVVYLVLFYAFKATGKIQGYAAVSNQGTGPWNPYERAIAEGEIKA